jgi:hypothetical protein
MEVDLVLTDAPIHNGHRKPCPPDQVEKETLHLAADKRRLVGELGEEAPERRSAAASGSAPKGAQVEESQGHRCLQGISQFRGADYSREVHKRASGAGAGNAVMDHDVGGVQRPGPVQDDPCTWGGPAPRFVMSILADAVGRMPKCAAQAR